MAAKSISTQIKKFWYPADTVPADVVRVTPSLILTIGEIAPTFSKAAKPTPVSWIILIRITLLYQFVLGIEKNLTLPKGQENHRFDCAKFKYRIKWR